MRRYLLGLTFLLGVVIAVPTPAAVAATPLSSLSLQNTAVREGDDGAATATMTLRRSGVLLPLRTYRVTVEPPHSTDAPDVELGTSWVTLPALAAGTQTAVVTVRVLGDLFPEPTEDHYVSVEAATEGALGHLFIQDTPDPSPPPRRLAREQLFGVEQQLISRAADGAFPNAPATEPALSWDARTARYAAYTSAATNITTGTDGHRNVYLVKRGGAAGRFGTRWVYGATRLASQGRGGRPANGDSWGPALGGWVHIDDAGGPVCLAFVSRATNLVRGDTNGQADVFYRRAAGGPLRRLASPRGRPATEAAVAGSCGRIAMVAGGALYVARARSQHLQRIAGGGVSSPRLSYNGAGVSYARGGHVFAQRTGRGRARSIGSGRHPSPDGGSSAARPQGSVRALAYERAGRVFLGRVGGGTRSIGAGATPSATAGAAQVLFGWGPWVYMYATSNHFGKPYPQGICPAGQGAVTDTYASARANYVAFACAGGAIYLSYIGPK